MRVLGWLAMVLGVVGVIVCAVIAIGVWVVRPDVVARVDHVATVAMEGLDQAAALSTDAADLTAQVSQRLDTVATTAASISSNPVIDATVDRVLGAAINNVVSGPWNQLQDRLGGFRERVVSISNTVQALDEAIPFIELPGVATGFVNDVDARWTELDQAVESMEGIASGGVATAEQAGRVAAAATDASQRLDAVGTALAQVHGNIEMAQSDIAHAADQVEGLLGWVAIVLTVVAIWVGLLHLLLIAQGRRWVREEG